MGVGLPNGFEPTSAQLLVNRYEEIISDLQEERNGNYIDYLNYDFFGYTNPKFKLTYRPAKNSIRFFINGVLYTDASNAFIYDEELNIIEWAFTADKGGFDLSPNWNYMAIYDFYLADNTLYENIENAVNALILINTDLVKYGNISDDIEKEKEFAGYLARQISKGNLTYNAVKVNYPDLMELINTELVSGKSNSRVMQEALNTLLLINPKLLYLNNLSQDISRDMVIEYIKQQISYGYINKDELLKKYPEFIDLV